MPSRPFLELLEDKQTQAGEKRALVTEPVMLNATEAVLIANFLIRLGVDRGPGSERWMLESLLNGSKEFRK